MKLLIEIPEEQYRTLNATSQDDVVVVVDNALLIEAIKNGTPLPEHHGDLKDISQMIYEKCNECGHITGVSCRIPCYEVRRILGAPTIIPAIERSNDAVSD